ncbi:MAG: hypothetical protein N3A38_17095, partial [Planctomycetota bacterium]|nr:hypothetical protein [Planctomycetota bacterium]
GVSDDTLMKARSAIALVQVALMGRRLLKAAPPAAVSEPGEGRLARGRTWHSPATGIRDPKEMYRFTQSTQREVATSIPKGKSLSEVTGKDVRLSVGPKASPEEVAWVASPPGHRTVLHTHRTSGMPEPSEDDLKILQNLVSVQP